MLTYNNVQSRVIIKCNIQWFYYSLLYNCLYSDYIIVIRHPDDGHWSGRNMLVENKNFHNHIHKWYIYRTIKHNNESVLVVFIAVRTTCFGPLLDQRTETCRPNSNKDNEDTLIVVFDGSINIL